MPPLTQLPEPPIPRPIAVVPEKYGEPGVSPGSAQMFVMARPVIVPSERAAGAVGPTYLLWEPRTVTPRNGA
ncbi:hypothetical protein GCM10009736_13370 [Actinomadura bangladeshensis]